VRQRMLQDLRHYRHLRHQPGRGCAKQCRPMRSGTTTTTAIAPAVTQTILDMTVSCLKGLSSETRFEQRNDPAPLDSWAGCRGPAALLLATMPDLEAELRHTLAPTSSAPSLSQRSLVVGTALFALRETLPTTIAGCGCTGSAEKAAAVWLQRNRRRLERREGPWRRSAITQPHPSASP